ncbi:hypothetical protein [Sulfurovum sp. TSL1]|uniref:hypothetical protein n=1 Tax=Sulfurovum sp. TSL1 TaxID=2826994 RepID=UPI001CC687A5|nr:hypothetical protein [Sulfurovum sp. TSL1]GIT97297.1 hypothetical protein TSL1_01180 [Sulfurovum sp. TSL1]
MSPETKEWLSARVPTFTNLDTDEQNSIYDFTLLWSMFEGEKLSGYCNMRKIREYADELTEANQLSNCGLDEYLPYLIDRYYVEGSLNDKFQKLHIGRSGNPPEITESLCSDTLSEKTKLIGCLGIVFRLRNNLFHGEKWQYELANQKSNFDNASKFLMRLMSL